MRGQGPDIATGLLSDPELVTLFLWGSFPLTLYFVNLDRKDVLLLYIGIVSVLPEVFHRCYSLLISHIHSNPATVECKTVSLYYY